MVDRELLNGWAVSIGRHVGVGVLGLVWLIVLTRAMTPADVGVLVLVASLPALVVPLANLGVPMGLVYLVASPGEDEASLAAWTRQTAVRLAAAAGVLTALVVLALWLLVPNIAAPVLAGAASIPTAIATSVAVGWFQGQRRFGTQARLLLLPHLITTAGSLALWAGGLARVGAIVAIIVGAHAATAVVAVSLIPSPEAARPSREIGRSVWAYAWRVWLSEAGAAVRARLDLIVVAAMLGTSDAGLFAASTTLATQLAVLSLGANQVVFPIVAARSGTGDAATAMASRLTFVGTLLAAGAVGVAARPVLGVVYGDAFREGAAILVAYLPAVVLLSISRVVTADLYGRGEAGLVARLSLVATTVGIGLLPVGIHLWGAVGAAVAASLTAAVNTGIRVGVWWRLVSLPRPSLVAVGREDVSHLIAALRATRPRAT